MKQESLFPDDTAPRGLPDGFADTHGFLAASEAATFFERIRAETAWHQEHLRMFGRRIAMPRLTAWYGDPGASYVYSGIANQPLPWTESLRALRARVTRHTGSRFNSALLNLYRDGADSLAWHADDEPELGRAPTLASLSLGATRRFRIRQRRTRESIGVDLEAGSLIVMTGASQRDWEHCVPKTARAVGERINITFRWVEPRPGR